MRWAPSLIMLLVLACCGPRQVASPIQNDPPSGEFTYSTRPGGSTLNIGTNSGWRQHLGPSDSPGGTVNSLEYFSPNGAVTASIRGEYHPGLSFTMQAGSLISSPTCTSINPPFQPTMAADQFKSTLAMVGFDTKVINAGVDVPCHFASLGNSQISMSAWGSPTSKGGSPMSIISIVGNAIKKGDICYVSEIRVSGCDQESSLQSEMALQEGNAALARRDYAAAAVAFDNAYSGARAGAHAQDSLLGLANALSALGEKRAACDTLDKLKADFPTTREDLGEQINGARQGAGCR
jgi:hypothetical protein